MLPFRQIPGHELTITSEKGPYTFNARTVRRGADDRKFELFIEGFGGVLEFSDAAFKVEFNRKESPAVLEILGSVEDFCKVRVRTMVSDPEFWE